MIKTTTTTRDEYIVMCRKLNSTDYHPIHSTRTNTKEDALERFYEWKKNFGPYNDLVYLDDYFVAHHQIVTTITDWEKV